VQLPGTFDPAKDDKPGAEDARRQILSVSSCRNTSKGPFKGEPDVKLVILADRISLQ
jgi:hypothetical protein